MSPCQQNTVALQEAFLHQRWLYWWGNQAIESSIGCFRVHCLPCLITLSKCLHQETPLLRVFDCYFSPFLWGIHLTWVRLSLWSSAAHLLSNSEGPGLFGVRQGEEVSLRGFSRPASEAGDTMEWGPSTSASSTPNHRKWRLSKLKWPPLTGAEGSIQEPRGEEGGLEFPHWGICPWARRKGGWEPPFLHDSDIVPLRRLDLRPTICVTPDTLGKWRGERRGHRTELSLRPPWPYKTHFLSLCSVWTLKIYKFPLFCPKFFQLALLSLPISPLLTICLRSDALGFALTDLHCRGYLAKFIFSSFHPLPSFYLQSDNTFLYYLTDIDHNFISLHLPFLCDMVEKSCDWLSWL